MRGLMIFLLVVGLGTKIFGDEVKQPLLISVVRVDGVLFPIAFDRGGEFSNPWTEPQIEDGEFKRPNFNVPKSWLFYDSQNETEERIHSKSVSLVEVNCSQNWGVKTDLNSSGPKSHDIIGVAFNRRMTKVVPQSKWEGIRKELDLVGNGKEGESVRDVDILGYFEFEDYILGVALIEGWESERYTVFEIRGTKGRILTSVYGGGC